MIAAIVAPGVGACLSLMISNGVLIPLFNGDFGEYLVSQRRAAGWSQEELAERSTVSVRTIRNLETGAIKSPRRSSLDLLLGAFGSADATGRVGTLTAPLPADWRARCGTPQEPEPIVGRAADLAHVRRSLYQERRIVLAGPGGVGKTRLALAAADQLRGAYRDGVVIVEAGRLPAEGADTERDVEHLRQAVLTAASRASHAGLGPLPGESQMLLVIDNAEHVAMATTILARQIQAGCPGIHLIITSRRPVCMPTAPVWDVSPLAVHRFGKESDAVELFLRRAGAACPAIDLTDRLDAVRELCAKLDGIPFALELAALRLRSVSLGTLLRDGPIAPMLGQAASAGLSHQRTLADSVRWSYDMLTHRQRALLNRLARFPGTFTLEDVEHLHRCSGAPEPEVGLLAELVDSSLVHVERGPRYSYRLLGYVREFVRNWSDAIPAQRSDDPSRIP